jgi:CheY-like chemotaxis protein
MARILVIDDDPGVRESTARILGGAGHTVHVAGSGEEGFELAKGDAFDVILSDMRMPGLSGEETARLLRAEGVRTPIVALTANAFDDDKQACLAAGMDDFLVKPLSPDALRAVLTRFTRAGWTEFAARAKVR